MTDGSATLNQRIRADLEGHILSGDWPPGHRIPFEHQLMVTYGCSRMTVNKVLSAMATAGLIERRRRAGSFVAQPAIQSAVLQIPDIEADVTARGERYGYRLLHRQERRTTVADPPDAHLLTGQTVLDLASLHTTNGQPLMFEQRLINLATVPDAAATDFTTVSPGKWLLTRVPWTEAEHHIAAVSGTPETARHLNLPASGACLVVTRRTWRPDGTVTWVRQMFRGDRYHLAAHFTPTDPPQRG